MAREVVGTLRISSQFLRRFGYLRFTIVDGGERGIRTRISLADLDDLSFANRMTCRAQGSCPRAVDVTFTAAVRRSAAALSPGRGPQQAAPRHILRERIVRAEHSVAAL